MPALRTNTRALALLVLAACLLGGLTASAATPSPDTEDTPLLAATDTVTVPGAELPDMTKALVKVVVVMVLLLGLMAGGVILFQRFARGRLRLTGGDRPLRIVDKLALGPKTWVCLLNVCGRHLVLGVAEKEVNVLLEVSPSLEEEADNDFSRALAGLDVSGKIKEKKVGLKQS